MTVAEMKSTPEPELRVDVQDRVALLTFNRPKKLNALSGEITSGLQEELPRLAADADVGAIVLTGEGRAFCAGGDVSGMAKSGGGAPKTLEQRIDGLRQGQEAAWLVHSVPKVTIALVNGFAMGAGLGLAASCDLRLASSAAKFGTAYSKVGFGGDWGTTWQLTRLVGPAVAKELFFTADIIDAEEARRIGLVNRIYDAESFHAEGMEFASRLAHGPLVSYRWMKENVNLAVTSDFRSILDREAISHIRCGETDDHREGVTAFMEKRAPRFTGR